MEFVKNLIDKTLDIFFSKDKTKLYLLIIVIFGFILRLIAANNLMVGADDSHFATHAINFLGSGKLETYDQSAPLWFSLTDFFYKIFGVNQIGSRFASILFGSLSIILIFLFTREFFGKKAGLIAAFLLAISPFHIKNTLAEIDVMVMFFVLFGVFLFYKFLKEDKKRFLVLSSVMFGLALMSKIYALLFLPGLFIFGFYINYKRYGKIINKKIIKNLVLFSIIVFIFVIPVLTHNYLLYKDKGISDFMFSGILGLGKNKSAQYYNWDPGWATGHDYKGFFLGNSKFTPHTKLPGAIYTLGFLFHNDPVVLILGLIGFLFYLIKREKKDYLILFLLLFLLPWVYIGSIMLLAKHYIFELIFFLPLASGLISRIHKKIKNSKIRLRYLLIIILIFNLYFLGISIGGSYYAYYPFYEKSHQGKLMDFKNQISENSLVVVDSRIYRGQTAWIFNDRYYLEAAFFPLAIQQTSGDNQNQENLANIEVYFIECVIDDCGWGSIKDQPDLNQSMENMVEFFKNKAIIEKELIGIKEGSNYVPFILKKQPQTYFRIYKKILSLNPKIFNLAKSTHIWFYYPLNYDRRITQIFDDYITYNAFDGFLNKFAHNIILLSLIFALISCLIVIVMFILY